GLEAGVGWALGVDMAMAHGFPATVGRIAARPVHPHPCSPERPALRTVFLARWGQRIPRGAFEPLMGSRYDPRRERCCMSVSSRVANWPTLGLDEPGAGELTWPLRWGAEASDVDWNAEMRR